MNKKIRQVISCLSLSLLVFITQARAAEKAPLSDDQKLKMVEEMFDSPYSEEMYYRTDQLLLTATGSMLPVHKAPSVASIITAEDIKNLGATTLDEALESVPGLHVIPSDIAYLDPTYSIRGIYTNVNPQILFLINGLPFTMPYTGSRPATFRMPVANISRIEVIRGPGSAVYGADAFSGVVNIITKDGFEVKDFQSGFRSGSFDSNDYWLQTGGEWAGWNAALSVEYMTSNGDDDRIINQDTQSSLDSLFGTTASLAPGALDTSYNILDAHLHLSNASWTIRFWSWVQNNAGLGAGATQTLSNQSNADNEQYLVDMTYKKTHLLDNLDAELRLSYLYRHEDGTLELFPDGATLPILDDGNIGFSATPKLALFSDGAIGNPQKIDQQTSLDLTTNYTGFNHHRLRVGSGFKYIEEKTEEYKNFGPGVIDGTTLPAPPSITVINGQLTDVSNTPYLFMENQNRKIWYASIQDEWAFARKWELTAGIRYDDYSDFGNTINPRLALVWDTRYDLTTKLLYGKAFRAPSFSELFNKNNPVFLGNDNLEPEKIETFEMAFDYQPTVRFRTLLNLFYYQIEDLIEIVPDVSGSTQTAQNSKDLTGSGFELEAAWEIYANLKLKANCAYQRSKDKSTKKVVPYAPELQFFASADWTFIPNWTLAAQVYWIGDRHREAGDVRPDIEDYALSNLTLRKKNIFQNWEMALLVKNVFNVDIREPSSVAISGDYPMDGRSVYAELKFHY